MGKKKSKRPESQIRGKKRQMFFRQLQQVVGESRNKTNNSNDSDCTLLHTRNKRRTSPKKDFTFVHPSNIQSNDTIYEKYTCYRCKHFSEIPRNLSQLFCKRTPSFIAQCEVEISFIQAIVWLKAVAGCTSQISVEQLQWIFNRQWSIHDNSNYGENGNINDIYVEQLKSVNKDLPTYEKTDTRNTFVMSSPLNIFDLPYDNAPQRTIYGPSCASPEDTQNKRLNFMLNKSSAKPLTPDVETSLHSNDMFDSVPEHQDECFIFEEDMRYLAQATWKNDIERVNKEIVQDKNIFFTQNKYTNISNKHKSILPARNQSIESTLDLEYNFDGKCFTQMTSQYNLTDNMMTYDDSTENFVITQMNISEISNVCDDNFELEVDNNNPHTQMSNTATRNPEHDSAYSTSDINVLNYDTAITAKSITGDKRMPVINIGHRYELRSRNKKIITREKVTATPPIIGRVINFCREQSSSKRKFSSKEHKQDRMKDLSKKKKKNGDNMVSANWLNFVLESLNVENEILASIKVILSVLYDKRTAEEYAIRNYWKDTLEEEAINVMLNASDIFKIEKKPNICIKEIVMTIVKTLDEITTYIQLNKTSVWIYRIQIILELCNSLPVCIKIIDHLIEKLKSFQSILFNTTEIQQNMYIMMDQLHLVFYALNIALGKYRTIISNNQKSRNAENTLPHVTDLWKMRYISEGLEDAGLDLDSAEERWSNALENFTVASIEHFIQFAEKSFSLVGMLISQSNSE